MAVDYPALYNEGVKNVVKEPALPVAMHIAGGGAADVIEVDEAGFLYDRKVREILCRRKLDPDTLLEGEALSAFMAASKALKAHFEEALDDYGLSFPQFKAMLWLRESASGGTQLNAIAGWLGTTARNITGLIDALEAQGLVERVPDPSDRRAVIARLTPEGESRIQNAKRVHQRNVRRVMGVLTEAEKTALRHLSLQLIRATQSVGDSSSRTVGREGRAHG